jgi:hypothetical protein
MEGGSNDCALLVTTRSPASISAVSVLGPGERLGERDSRLGEFCGELERDDALERDTEGELERDLLNESELELDLDLEYDLEGDLERGPSSCARGCGIRCGLYCRIGGGRNEPRECGNENGLDLPLYP